MTDSSKSALSLISTHQGYSESEQRIVDYILAHQIRVQFASRKHPLAGDGKYGSRVKGSIALQSCGLQFLHPETGKPMAFTLPLPEGAFWKTFEG